MLSPNCEKYKLYSIRLCVDGHFEIDSLCVNSRAEIITAPFLFFFFFFLYFERFIRIWDFNLFATMIKTFYSIFKTDYIS